MRIRVMRLGSATREVTLPDGACVRHALEVAGFPPAGHTLSLNGQGCGGDAALMEGDIVTLGTKVEGGGR